MNGIMLLASPRKNGNTHRLAGYIKEKLAGHGIQIHQVDLYDLHIEPCIDCRKCKSGEQVCTLKDDLPGLYPRLDEAGFILFGTPIYWSAPTAQMKLLIDRLRPYYVNRKLTSKKSGLFAAAADGATDCDSTVHLMRRLSKALGMKFAGSVLVKAYEADDLKFNRKLDSEISTFAENLLLKE